jgi:hypothetical protein
MWRFFKETFFIWVIAIIVLILLSSMIAKANDMQSGNVNTNHLSDSAKSGATTGNQKATTGNQVVNVIVKPAPQPRPATKVITKIKYKTKVKKVKIHHHNRLQIMVGASKTQQEVTQDACGCTLTAKRVYQPDAGVQYLRDFGGFTGSIMATQNQSMYLGVGFNW